MREKIDHSQRKPPRARATSPSRPSTPPRRDRGGAVQAEAARRDRKAGSAALRIVTYINPRYLRSAARRATPVDMTRGCAGSVRTGPLTHTGAATARGAAARLAGLRHRRTAARH